jgi:hypothetical protein
MRGARTAGALALAALTVLGGCAGTSDTGGAVAARPAVPTEAPAPAVPPAPGIGPLAGTPACSLVPPAAAARLGGTGPGREEKIGAARACTWDVPGGDSFGVAVFDSAGLADAVGESPREPVGVGSGAHEAVRQSRHSSCAISIAVTGASRVDVQLTSREASAALSCDRVKPLADAVEPLLPPQSK